MWIEVENLTKRFLTRHGMTRTLSVTAVESVSFHIERGETLGLVGESGCGKSTVGRCLLRLVTPDTGRMYFDGKEIQNLRERDLKHIRHRMQIVFQNPLASLNPAYTVAGTLRDALRQRKDLNNRQRHERAQMLLRQVGLDHRYLRRRPAEMSGGELQRVSIARALAPSPDFIFLDEPTSALDPSVRGQISNLLAGLQERQGLTYLYVSHDLNVIQFLAHRVLVMYLGQIVEEAPTKLIFSAPRHPYTQALLAAAQTYTGADQPVPSIRGEVRLAQAGVHGCRFSDRCPFVTERCRVQEPPFFRLANNHSVRCWLLDETQHKLDSKAIRGD